MLQKLTFTSRWEKIGILILIFGHLLAAYFSFGFHHPDEHFQILEFANYFAGQVPDASKLPWEFRAEIRPWFQPLIHAVAIKTFVGLGIYNPFQLAFLFRVLYALFNIVGNLLLWREFQKRFELNPLWFLWISLVWFFPYIHVRTSSENLSGIFATFAFVLFLRGGSFFKIGLLFGFAFLVRFQIALGLFGFGLYLLYRDRKITIEHLKLLSAFLLTVAFGTLLDRIGYGHFVFTPFRYFNVNLVQGVAATFNPYPWYQYFIWLAQLNPLVSLPLLLGCVLYTRKKKFEALSAFVWSFFILHLFITNKEYRFLFPILNFVPFMAAVGLKPYESYLSSKKWFVPYAAISVLAFSISSLHGAAVETLWCVHMANRYSAPGETFASNRDYLDEFAKGYYSLKDHHIDLFHNGVELDAILKANPVRKVIIDGKLSDDATTSELAVIDSHSCEVIESARPMIFFEMRKYFPTINRLAFKAIYQCR